MLVHQTRSYTKEVQIALKNDKSYLPLNRINNLSSYCHVNLCATSVLPNVSLYFL